LRQIILELAALLLILLALAAGWELAPVTPDEQLQRAHNFTKRQPQRLRRHLPASTRATTMAGQRGFQAVPRL
jgi:hypothetical protein